uniref:Uncharacterized protein n=1 Tax=Physcomitrium patens TaxID=3218 RepID=A0A2K1KX31_PHYPA|nr:hypothetical protein PHYPA_005337 [Physcomitrium patens]PNR58343.1 hypothetical protein PHYPA_005338 [Physcomitrium patens]PNR58347.1 hypothetical protein PHYPA_005342 [Physcomitrium patens]
MGGKKALLPLRVELRTSRLLNGCSSQLSYRSSGEVGYRSPYLSHAKRALYHLSYIPAAADVTHRSRRRHRMSCPLPLTPFVPDLTAPYTRWRRPPSLSLCVCLAPLKRKQGRGAGWMDGILPHPTLEEIKPRNM